MAVARRLPSETTPVFATQSLGAALVDREGFVCEYVLSRNHMRGPVRRWHAHLQSRFEHLLDLYEPRVLVFDGVVPYEGMTRAWVDRPDVTTVWLRRGMWRPGAGSRWPKWASRFDLVIEPGDVASRADAGVAAAYAHQVMMVPPITYLDRAEILPADEAREELGIDPSLGTPVLVSLGAGNINDTRSTVSQLLQRLNDAGCQPFVARSPISSVQPDAIGAQTLRVYPVSRYLRAFEFAAVAGGYNSVHELVVTATPSLIVPNLETGIDDQRRRARYMEQEGLAFAVEDDDSLASALDALLHPATRARMRRRLERRTWVNGAGATAAAIASLSGVPMQEATDV